MYVTGYNRQSWGAEPAGLGRRSTRIMNHELESDILYISLGNTSSMSGGVTASDEMILSWMPGWYY